MTVDIRVQRVLDALRGRLDRAIPDDVYVGLIDQALAAAPEPLRVAGEEVERLAWRYRYPEVGGEWSNWLYCRHEANARDLAGPHGEAEPLVALAHAEAYLAAESALTFYATAWRDLGPEFRKEPERRIYTDAGKRALLALRQMGSVLALIEPSAGGGEKLIPVWAGDKWPHPMPVPPPLEDLRYGVYLNLRDMVRAAYRRRHLDPRLGHFIETNYADYLATFDEIDLALSPTPDQPKQEVKDV